MKSQSLMIPSIPDCRSNRQSAQAYCVLAVSYCMRPLVQTAVLSELFVSLQINHGCTPRRHWPSITYPTMSRYVSLLDCCIIMSIKRIVIVKGFNTKRPEKHFAIKLEWEACGLSLPPSCWFASSPSGLSKQHLSVQVFHDAFLIRQAAWSFSLSWHLMEPPALPQRPLVLHSMRLFSKLPHLTIMWKRYFGYLMVGDSFWTALHCKYELSNCIL